MGNKAVLGLLVLAALAAMFFLFGGADLFSGGAGSGDADSGGATIVGHGGVYSFSTDAVPPPSLVPPIA